jgi:hypothetical protein
MSSLFEVILVGSKWVMKLVTHEDDMGSFLRGINNQAKALAAAHKWPLRFDCED